MPLEVTFETFGDIALPFFKPAPLKPAGA